MKRELAGAVAIPIVLAILFLGPAILFNALVALIALGAVWEFYRIAEKTGPSRREDRRPRRLGAASRRRGAPVGPVPLRDARAAT